MNKVFFLSTALLLVAGFSEARITPIDASQAGQLDIKRHKLGFQLRTEMVLEKSRTYPDVNEKQLGPDCKIKHFSTARSTKVSKDENLNSMSWEITGTVRAPRLCRNDLGQETVVCQRIKESLQMGNSAHQDSSLRLFITLKSTRDPRNELVIQCNSLKATGASGASSGSQSPALLRLPEVMEILKKEAQMIFVEDKEPEEVIGGSPVRANDSTASKDQTAR